MVHATGDLLIIGHEFFLLLKYNTVIESCIYNNHSLSIR